jgi:hypothetical protein
MPISMSDTVLVRMIEEMTKPLAQADPYCPADAMISSYNAVLGAVKANHPDVPLLAALEPLQQNGVNSGHNSVNTGPMLALLAQLCIILEALQSENS